MSRTGCEDCFNKQVILFGLFQSLGLAVRIVSVVRPVSRSGFEDEFNEVQFHICLPVLLTQNNFTSHQT